MIEITRSLARQLRTVFRRTISETGRGIVNEPVLFHAGPDGLRVRIASAESAAEYHDPTARSPDAATVPFEFLSDCEGRNDDPVQLETSGGNEVLATWNHNSVPQMVRYSVPEVEHHFPDLPESFVENPPHLIAALHDSMQTAAPESIRYALHYVQLRGSGVIAATDGRQLLLQSGFEFPWDDVLIPSRSVFGSKELPQDQPVFNTNRRYLDRAIQLGFRKVHIFNSEAPVLCQDKRRSYVWALLTAGDIVKPTPEIVRIESPREEASKQPPKRTRERKGTKVTKPPSSQSNSTDTNGKATRETGVDELIDQAEQLKVSLRDSLTKTSEMVA